MSECIVQVAIGIPTIPERASGQPGHSALVSRGERDTEAIGSGIGQTLDAVGPEVLIFALFTIRDDRRTGCLELSDSLADCLVV